MPVRASRVDVDWALGLDPTVDFLTRRRPKLIFYRPAAHDDTVGPPWSVRTFDRLASDSASTSVATFDGDESNPPSRRAWSAGEGSQVVSGATTGWERSA